MKKKLLIVTVLCLLLVASTASAASWVFSYRNTYMAASNLYIDVDSVYQDGDRMWYWEREVFDEPFMKVKTGLVKWEVRLTSPRERKILEEYRYDAEGKEAFKSTTPDAKYSPVQKGSVADDEVSVALRYAKKGKDPGTRPTP